MSGITDEEWQKMSPEERAEFQVKNCIFCKIIKGEIPSKKVYDDVNFVGILDINPGAKGHVLLLPKKHVQIMPQLGTELNGELGVVAKKISAKIKSALGVASTSIFVANGAVAGQNAPHFMLHIIPRKDGDGVSLNPNLKNVSESKIVVFRDKFISALGLPTPGTLNEVKKEVPGSDEVKSESVAVSNNSDKTDELVVSEISSEEKDDLADIEVNTNSNVNGEIKDNVNDDVFSSGLDDVSSTKSENVPDKVLLDKISKLFD